LNLEQYGWDSAWESLFAQWRACGCAPARVVRQERGAWEVVTPRGSVFVQAARHECVPVTGDWAALSPGLDRIDAVLERRTVLQRRAPEDRGGLQTLAANADTLCVVMGLDGDFNLSRLERYLALAAGSRLRACVLLNKSDLCTEADWRRAQVERAAPRAEVRTLSAIEDDVPQLLGELLRPGETVVLAGSSGAGKSTILNRLFERDVQATRPVRESDGRGVHTTTRRELFLTPQGWLLMDLPGLRMVGLTGENALHEVFEGVEETDERRAANRKKLETEYRRARQQIKKILPKYR
jgi:ribosome biogenesis GTPase